MRMLIAAAVASSSVLSLTVANAQRAVVPVVEVYKSPTCGCCAKWVDHLIEAGFKTRVTDLAEHELSQLKTKAAVPSQAQSCHTALVGGYAIEGHVPAADVKRLLDEKPAVAGIAVPGMPIGSPGMEVDGMKPAAYKVLTFDKSGTTRTFSTYDRIKE